MIDINSMRPTAIHGVDRGLLAILVVLSCAIVGSMGSDLWRTDRLVIATSRPLAELRLIESEFAHWGVESPLPGGPAPVRLEWRILSPGDDRARVAGRRNPPDVLFGGAASSFDRLAGMQALSPLPFAGSPAWLIRRHSRVDGNALRPARVLFNDPRKDPFWLAEAKSLLGDGHFRDGYSRLVREAGHPHRIGRLAGWTSPPGVEGVAIPREARHPELSVEFLRFLAATGRAESAAPRPENSPSPEADALLADLLGATLVDAQDELWEAWSALKRVDYPETGLRLMTEPPPWPPASVTKMLGRQGEHAMSLVETLAGQLATDPTVRSWLVRSWLAKPRLINEALLAEIASAADGRLGRELRFRDWLRAEWTAWARQRYRRVARLSTQYAVLRTAYHVLDTAY
jgi:hypothetical protein